MMTIVKENDDPTYQRSADFISKLQSRSRKFQWTMTRLNASSWWLGHNAAMLGTPIVLPEDHEVDVAAVGVNEKGQIVLYFNGKYIDGVTMDQIKAGETAFVLAHEALHQFFDHIQRGVTKHNKLWNIITDLLINTYLVEAGLKDGMDLTRFSQRIQDGVFYDSLLKRDPEIWTLPPTWRNWSAEKIYDLVYNRIIGKNGEVCDTCGSHPNIPNPISKGIPTTKCPECGKIVPLQDVGKVTSGGEPKDIEDLMKQVSEARKNRIVDEHIDKTIGDLVSASNVMNQESSDFWSRLTHEEREIVRARMREISKNMNVRRTKGGQVDEAGQLPLGELQRVHPHTVLDRATWVSILKRLIRKSADSEHSTTSPSYQRQWRAQKLVKNRLSNSRIPDPDSETLIETHYLLVFVDTSGSMSDEHIDKCVGAFTTAPRELKIKYYSFDTVTYEVKGDFRKAARSLGEEKIVLAGRGGTDLNDVVHEVQKMDRLTGGNVDGVLVFTDGHWSTFKPGKNSKRWHFFLIPNGSDYAILNCGFGRNQITRMGDDN